MSDLGNKAIFGKNLTEMMNQKKMSVTDLASALGFSTSTVWDWANGKTYPRIDKIEMMANYFGEVHITPTSLKVSKAQRVPVVYVPISPYMGLIFLQ